MKRQTVSLCLIARNEEARIGTAIKSVLALVDEVVVVDTGSTDNTRIIAEGYGARVIDVPWTDDFSAARNAALDEATGDWVLILDADEHLQPVRPVEFHRLLHDAAAAGYRLRIVSPREETSPEGRCQVRLFRNDPDVRYEFPVHERIAPALEAWAAARGLQVAETQLAVIHEGNEPARRLRSHERSLRILRRAVYDHPGEPYFAYRLGRENLTYLDDEVLPVAGLGEAIAQLRAAWRGVDGYTTATLRGVSWYTELGVHNAAALLARGNTDEARHVIRRVRRFAPDHPGVLLQSAAAHLRHLQERREGITPSAARSLSKKIREDLHRLRRSETASPAGGVDRRVHDLYPLRYLGELALLEGRVSEAVETFEQALELDPAYSFAWLGMAECSRFAGDRKRAMKLYLKTVTESEWNHRAWLRGCDLMTEMGFHDNADSWLRNAARRFPEHPQASTNRVPAAERAPELPVRTAT